MNPSDSCLRSSATAGREPILLAGSLLVLAALAVYAGSLAGPFIFDDGPSIVNNPTIRRLGTALAPPVASGVTVAGRPVVNLSFALNYAASGTQVWSYHALNLAIHVLAGLTLLGVVRRTLRQPCLAGRFGPASLPLALAVAVLWTVHPLQTEAVTYVAQRAESLMGLLYLLTLYCFIRGATAQFPRGWYALSLTACLLGMATKEVMVSAPIIVLLYDRTFAAGSFGEAWRRRRWLYAAMAATWLLLGWLVLGTAGRGGTAGPGAGVGWWQYSETQWQAVAHYLWLSVWPHPLILDYGVRWAKQATEVLPYVPPVAALVAGTAVALWRRPALGFLGAWFLAILAPTSLVPMLRQTLAEHRMYLALAPVAAVAALGVYAWLGRRSWLVFVAAAMILGGITALRNQDYRSELAIWRSTVANRPDNAWAHANLAIACFQAGRTAEAVEHFETALRLQPDDAEVHYNLGTAYLRLGRTEDAQTQFEQALRIWPRHSQALNNLGIILLQAGRWTEAAVRYEAALQIDPSNAEAHNNLGVACVQLGRRQEARAQFEAALLLRPDYSQARDNLHRLEHAESPPPAH